MRFDYARSPEPGRKSELSKMLDVAADWRPDDTQPEH